MNETRALVVLYEGKEVPAVVLDRIGRELTAFADAAGTAAFIQLDSTDIAKQVTPSVAVEVVDSTRTNVTAEDQAIIYLGNKMAKYLGANFNPVTFASAILEKLDKSRNSNNKDAKAFVNALFILSQEDLRISKEILKKYNFNEDVINVIKSIYNYYQSL